MLIASQAIAQTGFRYDVSRLAGIGLEFVAQILYTNSQAARISQSFRSPDLANELVLNDDRSQVSRQALQDTVFERREVDLSLGSVCLTSRKVYLDVLETQDRGRPIGGGPGVAP